MRTENLDFVNSLESLTRVVKNRALKIPQLPSDAAIRAMEIPEPVRDHLSTQLRQYLQFVGPQPTDPIGPREMDIEHLSRFLRVYSAKLANPDILTYFDEGDIIEVYAPNHQQIFRSLEFFKHCSYDLFTLSVLPWNQLFRRPESILLEMMNFAEYIVMSKAPDVKSPVRPHLIRECYMDHNRSFLYSIKQTGCLLDSDTDEAKGYITIIRVNELDPDNAFLMKH